ncbi:uncharacterized protein CDAR_459601 [Caerostris darwini]|uniref:Uncharacterized protein n=1 Tax=Caerostris darwini TaxID=1538125 RepID=A0AAV4UTL6_9ARAC|nr:uncharacterized protein CDAR_459601 [Caerostris darwini]
MNKLLNLNPVRSPDDLVQLGHLHDTLEIQVRSLKSLNVKSEACASMLIFVLLRILPPDITLEFNRISTDSSDENIEKLPVFLKRELECRERNNLSSVSHSNRPI